MYNCRFSHHQGAHNNYKHFCLPVCGYVDDTMHDLVLFEQILPIGPRKWSWLSRKHNKTVFFCFVFLKNYYVPCFQLSMPQLVLPMSKLTWDMKSCTGSIWVLKRLSQLNFRFALSETVLKNHPHWCVHELMSWQGKTAHIYIMLKKRFILKNQTQLCSALIT